MAEPSEELLRRSLDEADRSRTRLLWASVAAGVVLLGTMTYFVYRPRSHGGIGWIHDLFIVLSLEVAFCTFVVCWQIARVGRRILRGLEQVSRR